SPIYLATFGNNGAGNSQFCIDPSTPSTHCGTSVQNGGTAVYSPVVFSVVIPIDVLISTGTDCSHSDAGLGDNNNIVQSPSGDGSGDPCSGPSGDEIGAF